MAPEVSALTESPFAAALAAECLRAIEGITGTAVVLRPIEAKPLPGDPREIARRDVQGGRLRVLRLPMSAEQEAMVDDPRRVLWIGTGTKTGKTSSGAQWLVEGVGQGERCAWVGPTHMRALTGFSLVRGAFEEATRAGLVRVRESPQPRVEVQGGGVLEVFSGENPEAIYGDAFRRVFVDEATRQPAAVYPAVMSTVTSTGGLVRFAFNLDRGRRHWAIAGFVNARAGGNPTEGHVFLRTSQSPYVTADVIEEMRRRLPDRVFRALYNGEIQEDGAAVIRNTTSCLSGELAEPQGGRAYVLGVDLAKTFDWTVQVVVDVERRHVVAFERFHGLPWHTQRERIALLARRYNNALVVPDATGAGDPNVEELIRMQLRVRPVVITGGQNVTERGVPKAMLIERLVTEIEHGRVTWPAALDVLTTELDALEYDTRPSGAITYGAPEGMHDDAVIALALALWECVDFETDRPPLYGDVDPRQWRTRREEAW